jgi:hypothetical protein
MVPHIRIEEKLQTPENRTVRGQTWVWIWNGAGTWYQQNTQAQIVADKKSYKVGDVAHLLLVTGLPESWAVVTAEAIVCNRGNCSTPPARASRGAALSYLHDLLHRLRKSIG